MSARRPHRRGLTFFEVITSTLVVVFGVLTSLMVLPVGMRTQRDARWQMHATAEMLHLLADFGARRPLPIATPEGERPADAPWINASVFMPDLERAALRMDGPWRVLPEEIARRLESDDDEIARILDEGGQLYYPAPGRHWGSAWALHREEDTANDPVASGRGLVFGLIGAPQQNALNGHPQHRWPVWDHYPTPLVLDAPSPALYAGTSPTVGWEHAILSAAGVATSDLAALRLPPLREFVTSADWTGLDDDAAVDWAAYRSAAGTAYQASLRVLAGAPFELPLDPATGRLPLPIPDGSGPLRDARPSTVAAAAPDLMHAAVLLLRHHAFLSGVVAAGGDPAARSAFTADAAWMSAYARHAQTALVDDWRFPRPLNRQLCTDYPLLQFDLESPDLVSAPGRYPGDPWRQWRVLAPPDSAVAMGRATGWSTDPAASLNRGSTAAADSGDPANWNLTRPFDPAERCRELVVWAADWRNYEDYEQAPASPMDAAHLSHAPTPAGYAPWREAVGELVPGTGDRGIEAQAIHRRDSTWVAAGEWYERLHRKEDGLTLPNAFTQGKGLIHRVPWSPWLATADAPDATTEDETWTERYRSWLGWRGADRDGNGIGGGGNIRPGSRMRAVTVARFVVYDPRGWVHTQ